MNPPWNAERINAFAPDPASAKAAQGLASPRKWGNLGKIDHLLWGECQGSGKDPYQTKIDLETEPPAFSCSCPSRKFPCKHGLGLMLVWVANASSVAEASAPAWVVSWKEGRDKKAEVKKEKAERGPEPVDLAAQAKRAAARLAKVQGGLDDLALWVSDLVRQGFTALSSRPGNLWDEQARRMVDAQAPGLARRLRQIDDLSMAGDGWPIALVERLGRLHLLSEGFRNIDRLEPLEAEDVRNAVGFAVDLDQVRKGEGIRDRWEVVGHAYATEDRVNVRRSWLFGRASRRAALLLDFSAGNRSFEMALPIGYVVDAELAFVPSAFPLRGVVKGEAATVEPVVRLEGTSTIAEAFAVYGRALARNPWLELLPVALADVVLEPIHDGEAWQVRDPNGHVMPLSSRFRKAWHVLALGGGQPFTITGEFNGETLEALGALIDGRFRSLESDDSNPQTSASIAPPLALPTLLDAAASAVVGLDRKPLPSDLAEPFASIFSNLDSKDSSNRLLGIAGASGLYGRVGRTPEPVGAAIPERQTAPEETQDECRAVIGDRLKTLMNPKLIDLVPEWLAMLAASGGRVPYDGLVDLLQQQTIRHWPIGDLSKCLGVRGRWLASQNRRWRKYSGVEESADLAAVWETGTRHERLAAIKAIRESDPAHAAKLIADTFTNEPADVRSELIDALSIGLSMADEPFLESTLDDRSKEVRAGAAALLKRLPDSRLVQRMVERAKVILSVGIDSENLSPNEMVLKVDPPNACDASMQRDGLLAKPPAHQTAVWGLRQSAVWGLRGYWLYEILSSIPPAIVSDFLKMTPKQLVGLAHQDDWQSPLDHALTNATARSGGEAWIEAILDPDRPGWTVERWRSTPIQSLWKRLPRDNRDSRYLALLNATKGSLIADDPATVMLDAMDSPVGLAVGRALLERLRSMVDAERIAAENGRLKQHYDSTYHAYTLQKMTERLSMILPAELVDDPGVQGIAPLEATQHYYEYAFAKMIQRLRVRRDIQMEFAS